MPWEIDAPQDLDLLLLLLLFSLRYLRRLVNFAALLVDAWFLIVNIDVHDVKLVELPRPSLRDSILDLLLELLFVRALGQSLTDTLLMKLVEFIIKLGDHLLDILSLFLLIQLVNDGLLDVLLGVALDDVPLRIDA